MKFIATLFAAATLTASGLGYAQSDAMKGMDMSPKAGAKPANPATHEAVAVVKKVDAANGKVVLSHEPVKSLNWPAMTMGFAVKDKALLQKLPVGSKVEVQFSKQDNEYVITKVK